MRESASSLRAQFQALSRRINGSVSVDIGHSRDVDPEVVSRRRSMLFTSLVVFLFIFALMAQHYEITYNAHVVPPSLSSSPAFATTGEANGADGKKDAESSSNHHHQSDAFHYLGDSLISYLRMLLYISLILSVCSCMMAYQMTRWAEASRIREGSNGQAGRTSRNALVANFLRMAMSGNNGGPQQTELNRFLLRSFGRNFTGDDFEMLQQLDSPAVNQGASAEQISHLPEHVISDSEVVQDVESGGQTSCNICLGPYEAGENVRTLPCMHRFHQPCIDHWLGTKAECPVCKTHI